MVDSAIGEQVRPADRDETETAMGTDHDRDEQPAEHDDQHDDANQYIDRSKIGGIL